MLGALQNKTLDKIAKNTIIKRAKRCSMTFAYAIFQDGLMVAKVEAPTDEEALREAHHYAFMYAQDGPVELRKLDTDLDAELF